MANDMRSLWVAVITVALPAGSAVGVAGQSEGEAPTFTFVTGKVMKDSSPKDDWEQAWMDGGVVHVLGWRVERSIDWSDPRLPSEMVSRMNVDTYLAEDDIVQTFAETYRLEGSDGVWTGIGRALAMEHGHEAGWLMVLTGEGAYEGLSVMLVRETVRGNPDRDEIDHTLMKGYIFEGEMPQMPDPIAPSVE
jgi:hypothetical protein